MRQSPKRKTSEAYCTIIVEKPIIPLLSVAHHQPQPFKNHPRQPWFAEPTARFASMAQSASRMLNSIRSIVKLKVRIVNPKGLRTRDSHPSGSRSSKRITRRSSTRPPKIAEIVDALHKSKDECQSVIEEGVDDRRRTWNCQRFYG